MRLLLFFALITTLLSAASCTLSKKDRKTKSKADKVNLKFSVPVTNHVCTKMHNEFL